MPASPYHHSPEIAPLVPVANVPTLNATQDDRPLECMTAKLWLDVGVRIHRYMEGADKVWEEYRELSALCLVAGCLCVTATYGTVGIIATPFTLAYDTGTHTSRFFSAAPKREVMESPERENVICPN